MSWLTEHLDEVGESYVEHLAKASGFAVVMLVGGVACLIHSLLPFLFTRSASDRIRRLHQAMLANGRRPAQRSSRRSRQSDDIRQEAATGQYQGRARGTCRYPPRAARASGVRQASV